MALVLIIGAFFYFIPALAGHKKQNAGAIFALNLFLGWTLIGWVVALVWAMTKDTTATVVVNHPSAVATGVPVLCPHCGKYGAPGSKFCKMCGKSVVDNEPVNNLQKVGASL
jgi:Superinfection immunity protein